MIQKNLKIYFSFIIILLLFTFSYAQFTQTVKLSYVDSGRMRQGLLKVIARSQQVYGGGDFGAVGEYLDGTIVSGAGNGLTFRDVTVELITIEGDTANPNARLYIFTPQRDREVTLSRGNSDLVDNYRVRVNEIDFRRQEVDITIRVAGNTFTNTGGLHPPGKVNITANRTSNTVTITADYQVDLTNLLLWVRHWDTPQNQSINTPQSFTPSSPGYSSSGTQQRDESAGLEHLQAILDYQAAYQELKRKYESKEITFEIFDQGAKRIEREKNEKLNKIFVEPGISQSNS